MEWLVVDVWGRAHRVLAERSDLVPVAFPTAWIWRALKEDEKR